MLVPVSYAIGSMFVVFITLVVLFKFREEEHKKVNRQNYEAMYAKYREYLIASEKCHAIGVKAVVKMQREKRKGEYDLLPSNGKEECPSCGKRTTTPKGGCHCPWNSSGYGTLHINREHHVCLDEDILQKWAPEMVREPLNIDEEVKKFRLLWEG